MKLKMCLIGVVCGMGMLFAAESKNIEITQPYTYTTQADSNMVGVFMQIKNLSSKPIRLLSGESKRSKIVEIHAFEGKGKKKKMVAVKELEIKPNESIDLKPGDLHIMLIDIKSSLKEGEKVDLTLHFDNKEKITLQVPVQERKQDSSHGTHKKH